MTFREIIEKIFEIAENHGQINSWEYSKMRNMKDNILYPALHVVPVDTSMGDALNVGLNIIIDDRLQKGFLNELQVHSDTLSICRDIRAALTAEKISVYEDFTLTPFTDDNDDETAGWVMSFNIKIPEQRDACAIPQ